MRDCDLGSDLVAALNAYFRIGRLPSLASWLSPLEHQGGHICRDQHLSGDWNRVEDVLGVFARGHDDAPIAIKLEHRREFKKLLHMVGYDGEVRTKSAV